MILQTSDKTRENLFFEVDHFREKFDSMWGINKKEEIVRLLYEIARREETTLESVYVSTLKPLQDQGDGEVALSFRDIKGALLKRRYPTLTSDEHSKVLLTPVRNAEMSFADEAYGGFVPKKIYIEEKAVGFPLTEKILKRFPEIPHEVISTLKDFRKNEPNWLGSFGKDTLLIGLEAYDFLKPCACTSNALPCNYYVLNLGFGCPFDCSYCYLQFYQNTPAIVVYANPERFTQELDKVLTNQKGLWTRIGTGEFTDSLALDSLTEYSKILVPYFKDKNVFFELKTKSDQIENLLGLDHGGKTVVSWSVNPACLEKEESKTAPIQKRIEAARRCQEAGYPVAFHFDPVFYFEGWEKHYQELIEEIYSALIRPPQWVSIGTFRYHRDLKKVAEFRHPTTRVFLGEQVQDTQDDKFRYPDRVRTEIYQKMFEWLRAKDVKTPIYLCMESPDIWKAAFEKLPYAGRIDSWIVGKPIQSTTCG